MKFFDVLKGVLAIVVDIGAGVVIGHYTGTAVKAAKGIEKVCAGVASVAISGMIGAKAADWMSSQVDQVQEAMDKLTANTEGKEDVDIE